VITLAQHGWEARGIDFVPKAIRLGERKARRAGVQVELLVGDVTDPNLVKNQYDLVLDIGCYHILNPKQRAAYQENLVNVLTPGGTFLLYGFLNQTPENTWISAEDIQVFSKHFKLTDRQDGQDEAGGDGCSSVWLWFKAETQE
jgi:cyclopropane fatty-acyl-phospholipid synthase-like methyltransferase